MNAGDPLLTSEEVARILRVSERHLRFLRSTGKLAYVRTGHKTVRYRSSDLGDFIEAHRREVKR